MDKELSQWLERVNLEMSNADVPYIRRPHHAFMRLSRERGMSVIIPSPLMNHISAWFRDRSPAAAHEMGSLFTSTFYYDSFFWKVEVKFGYGTVEIAPTDALTQMPEVIKNQLRQDVPAMARYVASWMNSVDYGWGMDDLKRGAELPKVGNYEFASKLTSGAHQQLTASARLLTETRVPNAKSLEAAASATEMFLKAYLALHASLSKEDAKKLGHKLGKLARYARLKEPMLTSTS
jgi:hypothetical protein